TQKFEKSVGFSNGAFASQLKNNKSIGVDKLENILKAYPDLDINWVLEGKGEMIKSTDDHGVLIVSEPKSPYGLMKGIPLVAFPAVAGKGGEHFGFTENDIVERYDVPKFRNKRVDFLIEVEGSSMVPKFKSGDVVACRII
ncbi:hypothetical protein RXR98_29690, partial [Pseudomonas aeruginosa]|nr:hypothetical protein [Pseudomonas aeruginosa]